MTSRVPSRKARKPEAAARELWLRDAEASMMKGKTRCVLFLQNAWRYSVPPGMEYWARDDWLWALWRCNTGRKIQLMWPDAQNDRSLWVDNTTPKVGVGSNSVMPPMPEWVENVLEWHDPEFVIACGKQAENSVLPLWPGRLIVMPHPAHRVNTNNLFKEIAQVIKDDSFHRHRVVQEPGRVVFTPIV